jgi:hypothetical protein
MNGWLGEVQGRKISLDAATDKLTALDKISASTSSSITHLGTPIINSPRQP